MSSSYSIKRSLMHMSSCSATSGDLLISGELRMKMLGLPKTVVFSTLSLAVVTIYMSEDMCETSVTADL